MKKIKQRAFDVLGNIAIANFKKDVKFNEKVKFAEKILRENRAIRTVLEKIGKVHGRLRKIETKHLAGEKTKEVLYRENGCVFRFNVDTTYFSPRLANERKEVARLVKKKDRVLVLFAGVCPFSIVIAKNSKAEKVYSNEINREANKYGKINIELNNLRNKVEMLDGDAKKICEKLAKQKERFDVIVMPRPNLKETFLKGVFKLTGKGTRIYYYGFTIHDDRKKFLQEIKDEAKKAGRKIKIIKTKIAGWVSPGKVRMRVDIKIE